MIGWIIVTGIGFALMAFSYFNYQYDGSSNTWKDGFIYIGKADPNSEAQGLEYVKRPSLEDMEGKPLYPYPFLQRSPSC